MAKFIPGLQLSEQFYKEVVKDLIETEFHGLKYSAALIGSGSEVLGFDTPMSADHHWGPRVIIFISSEDIRHRKRISSFLSTNLPPKFKGYSTNFSDPDELNVQMLIETKKGEPINHRVGITTIKEYFQNYLGINPYKKLTIYDWLTLSEQKLGSLQSGKIFHDKVGLKKALNKIGYYPKDVWLYLLASEWAKISQEEPFVGRCGDVKDEIGSSIIAARLVQSIMKLCFLMEKEYSPYSKWFGTAFSKLKCAKKLSLHLSNVLNSSKWKEREKHFAQTYKILVQMHNRLKLTKPFAARISSFHGRPYKVIRGDVFANELKKKIKEPAIKRISANIGSVNQLTDTVDLLENDKLLRKLKVLYK
ncbi:DUF4037 domain-containing protein [Patescibacteria group bacterium]